MTPAHLESLDRYEGPHTYARRELALPDGRPAWIYLDWSMGPGRPPPNMWAAAAWLADFGFDPAPLEAALAAGG